MVRIATDKSQRRTAWVSLLGALGAGAVALFALSAFHDDPPMVAPQRTLVDVPVRWTCELDSNHEFTANGRFDPLPCRRPPCPGKCYIHLRYVCLAHDREFDAWVQFVRRPEGNRPGEKVSQYRYLPRGPWSESPAGRVPCPVADCDAETRPVSTAWSSREERP